MGKFSRSAPSPQSPDEFVASADYSGGLTGIENNDTSIDIKTDTGINTDTNKTPRNKTTNRPSGASRKKLPWDNYKKKATAKNIFNLRLNDYYLTILRHLADQDDDRSMQSIVKEILLPELEQRAGINNAK